MESDNILARSYLEELRTRTRGDGDARVSMFEVGEALGLERAEAGSLAEDLIVQGWVELKTLAGGIGITAQGLSIVNGAGAGPSPGVAGLRLGGGAVLDADGRLVVAKLVADIRAAALDRKMTLGQAEELLVDVKTLEVQMLSPRPKTAIVRELLRSMQGGLQGLGARELAGLLDSLLAS